MGFPKRLAFKIGSHILKNRIKGKKRFALVLQLEPSHLCNLSCAGCGRIREYRATINKMLSPEACVAAANECDAPMISICGGEPLVYPHIREVVNALLGEGRVVYLCTNGILMRRMLTEYVLSIDLQNGSSKTQELIEKGLLNLDLLEAARADTEKKPVIRPHPRFFWNVHLDGMERTHDSIVGRPGVFQECIKAIKLAKSLRYQVAINTTVYAQTDMDEIDTLFDMLSKLGVDGFTISPGYDFDEAREQLLKTQGKNPDEFFLTRELTRHKFAGILKMAKKYNIFHTWTYLEFLAGKRDLRCTPWAIPTYNVAGWKAPCYLITDTHYPSFNEMLQQVNWDAYGVVNGHAQDKRCKNCMAHCGYDPTGALGIDCTLWDTFKNLKFALKQPRNQKYSD